MNRRRFLLTGLAVTAALTVAAPAFADTPAPMSSYKRVSPNGAYVFVMLGKAGRGSSDVSEWEGYTQSGLYPNDGSRDPLWTVDWYAYNVDIASDGVHLVRHVGPATSLDGEAIGFFSNGSLLRSYSIGELVDDEQGLQRSVSFLHWRRDGWFIPARLEYRLMTLDGNWFLFDMTTGEIVSECRAIPNP